MMLRKCYVGVCSGRSLLGGDIFLFKVRFHPHPCDSAIMQFDSLLIFFSILSG